MLDIVNWTGVFMIGFLVGALVMYLVILIHTMDEDN